MDCYGVKVFFFEVCDDLIDKVVLDGVGFDDVEGVFDGYDVFCFG